MPLPENIIYNQFLPNKQTSMWKTKSSYNTDIQKYILKKMSAIMIIFVRTQYVNYLWPNNDTDLGQYWLRYNLLPDGTKPLPETMLIYHQ